VKTGTKKNKLNLFTKYNRKNKKRRF